MKRKKLKIFSILRIFCLCIVGLAVAFVVALSQINLDNLRGNIVAMLREATGVPVEVDGPVSWKLSLRPQVELNQVRVMNKDWAKNKNAFSAEKIDVRLNLISLLRDKPTIQNIIIYDAKINLEKNADGRYSVVPFENKNLAVQKGEGDVQEMYPFKDAGLGGVEIKNLNANILGQNFKLAGFNVRMMPKHDSREYTGWLKLDTDVHPFIVSLSPYNAERKVYPVRVAMSTGGDALIANIALEGTSKMPIDFIVKGDIAKPELIAKFWGFKWGDVSKIKLNVAGGFDVNKFVLHKSSVMVGKTEFTVLGEYNWGKPIPMLDLDLRSVYVDLQDLFPDWYDSNLIKPNRKLNVFHDTPLYADWFWGKNARIRMDFNNFIVYRNLNVQNLDLKSDVNIDQVRIDMTSQFANGNFDFAVDADIEENGHVWAKVAVKADNVSAGEILRQVHTDNYLSDLPVNLEMFVQANGKNLSEIMQTITGPVQLYSVGSGYAHSELVSHMYGTDFLTSLRHSIEDLFSSEKKHNQIKVSCLALNAKLRDGVFETQNGFAIETNAINIRLAGMLDLGQEELKMSLTTVPVRGLKLSLTGNVVNSIELTGSLAEPKMKISGAAVAGKVASATGLGLLLAPFTGGIGLVAGTGIGLVAGDLLENWLSDGEPCKTAMKRGAPVYPNDPDWFNEPIDVLMNSVLGD